VCVCVCARATTVGFSPFEEYKHLPPRVKFWPVPIVNHTVLGFTTPARNTRDEAVEIEIEIEAMSEFCEPSEQPSSRLFLGGVKTTGTLLVLRFMGAYIRVSADTDIIPMCGSGNNRYEPCAYVWWLFVRLADHKNVNDL